MQTNKNVKTHRNCYFPSLKCLILVSINTPPMYEQQIFLKYLLSHPVLSVSHHTACFPLYTLVLTITSVWKTGATARYGAAAYGLFAPIISYHNFVSLLLAQSIHSLKLWATFEASPEGRVISFGMA